MLEVGEEAKGNFEYFDELNREMNDGGLAAMLYDLLEYDISRFNIRDVPKTEGLKQQQKLSLPPTERWWKACLEREFIFKSKLGLEEVFGKWLSIVSTALLYESYMVFARENGVRNPLSIEDLNKFMIGMGFKKTRPNCGIIGEHMKDDIYSHSTRRIAAPIPKDRPHGYDLGNIAHARSLFEEKVGFTVNWDQ